MTLRLVVDENISWRLKRLLPDWEIVPANEIARNKRLTDLEIWNYAKKHDFLILTFDEDFIDLFNYMLILPKLSG